MVDARRMMPPDEYSLIFAKRMRLMNIGAAACDAELRGRGAVEYFGRRHDAELISSAMLTCALTASGGMSA